MSRPDTCPICGTPSSPEQAPFCSQGCRDRDLLRWLGEAYRVPATGGGSSAAPDGLDSPDEPR